MIWRRLVSRSKICWYEGIGLPHTRLRLHADIDIHNIGLPAAHFWPQAQQVRMLPQILSNVRKLAPEDCGGHQSDKDFLRCNAQESLTWGRCGACTDGFLKGVERRHFDVLVWQDGRDFTSQAEGSRMSHAELSRIAFMKRSLLGQPLTGL